MSPHESINPVTNLSACPLGQPAGKAGNPVVASDSAFKRKISNGVKELRQITSCGVLECKKALEEAKGDMKLAMEALRKRGVQLAAKKADRVTLQGRVESYIHSGGKIGVLVEINCETDFVAKNAEFQKFTKDIAMQIAAMEPEYIKKEEVSKSVLDKEGADFYKQACLLEQPFIKDQNLTINDYLTSLVAKTGENIVIKRFTRYRLGE